MGCSTKECWLANHKTVQQKRLYRYFVFQREESNYRLASSSDIEAYCMFWIQSTWLHMKITKAVPCDVKGHCALCSDWIAWAVKPWKFFYYLKDKAVESSCGLKCWRPLFHSPAKLTSQSCTSHDRSFGNPSHVDRISVSMFKSKHAKLVLLNCQSVKNLFFWVLVRLFLDVFDFNHFIISKDEISFEENDYRHIYWNRLFTDFYKGVHADTVTLHRCSLLNMNWVKCLYCFTERVDDKWLWKSCFLSF